MKLYWYVCLVSSMCCPMRVGATDQSMTLVLLTIMMQSVASSSESSDTVMKEKKQERKRYCAHLNVRPTKHHNNKTAKRSNKSPKNRR